MATDIQSLKDALAVFGLAETAGLTEAKSAFRRLVKSLHPDRTPPTEASLSALSDAITAMRLIEAAAPLMGTIEISEREALTGVTRMVSFGLRREFVRIPPGTVSGSVLGVVGDPNARITIDIVPSRETMPPANPDQTPIEAFIRDFAAPSPVSRFAGWVRGPRTAA